MSDEIDEIPKKSDEIIYYINYGREIERGIKCNGSKLPLFFFLGVFVGFGITFVVMLP